MMAKVKAIADGKETAGKKGETKPKKPGSHGRRARFLASEKLGNIIERISDGFVAFDTQMNYTYVNRKGGELLGRKPEDLIGKNYWVEFPEARGTPFAKAYQRALKTQTPIVLEDYYEPFDRWFENRIYPSKDGLSIFFTEITERKKAEQFVRASQERLTRIVETIPDGITIVDREGAITFANSSAERILGLTRAGITQRTYNDPQWKITTVDGGPFPDDELPFARVKAGGGSVYNVEHAIVYPDGKRVVLSINASALVDGDGNFDGMVASITDITERMRAQEELQRGERVLRLFIEYSPAAIAMFDREMKYIVASRRYLIDYELGEQNVVGRSHYEIFPEIPERWKEIHRRCLAGATERNEEDPFPRASGKLDWIRWEIRPWYEADGEIGGIILFSEVITERKRTTEQVRYQANLLANVNDAVLASDENFVLTAWNKAAERIYGWKAEEVIGKSGAEILQTEFLTISRPEAIKQLIESGEYLAEVINLRKDGAKIYIETRTTALRDPIGKTVGYVSINRDITERKRAEDELRESEQRFTTLFERSAFVAVLSSLPNGIILNVNMAFEQVLGFTKEEAIGRTTLELGINPDAAGRQRVLAQLQTQGSAREVELELHTKSGETRVFSINVDLIDIGDEKYILNTMQDITKRKQAEVELRLSRDRLADLSRRLSEIRESEARTIGRELHDQVGQMLTALKLTLEIAAQLPSEAAANKLSGAQELIEELMNRVSRLTLDLRPPMLDDLGLLPALLWHINHYQEQTGIEVEFVHGGVGGRRFSLQIETTVYRIVQEALTNVVRHARATRVRIEVRTRSDQMEIQIEDNGAGFDPQVAYSKNRGLGGMRERISLLNGTINIESHMGGGSHISIMLPMMENE